MPACFQLICKETGRAAKLAKLDDKLRTHFGAEPDPENWFRGWYHSIGYALATGHDWNWCRDNLAAMNHIIEYLEQRYDINSWQEIGRSR